MNRRMVCGIGAALAVLTASGCGMLGGGGGETGSLESMLERVPSNANSRTLVMYGNLARLRGDSAPAGDERSELKQLMKASKGTFVIAEPAGTNIMRDDFTKESGFELRDIDYSIQAGQPPTVLSVFGGRFDAAKVDAALTKNASFAKETKTGEHAGVKTYSVGKDGTLDVRSASAFRPIGNALRIGATEDQIWITSKDQVLNEALDVADGDGTSLADDDRYVEVAKAVDEAKAFNAVVIGDPRTSTVDAAGMLGGRATPEQAKRMQELIAAGKLGLAPWQVAAVADAPGELVVVLAHADADAAKENEKRLRKVVEQGISGRDARPWADRLSVSSMEVDGDLLVAHLKSQVPIAFNLVMSKDNLIMIAKK
jgi:hypothetical protein